MNLQMLSDSKPHICRRQSYSNLPETRCFGVLKPSGRSTCCSKLTPAFDSVMHVLFTAWLPCLRLRHVEFNKTPSGRTANSWCHAKHESIAVAWQIVVSALTAERLSEWIDTDRHPLHGFLRDLPHDLHALECSLFTVICEDGWWRIFLM